MSALLLPRSRLRVLRLRGWALRLPWVSRLHGVCAVALALRLRRAFFEFAL
jgi:hypothetical protein